MAIRPLRNWLKVKNPDSPAMVRAGRPWRRRCWQWAQAALTCGQSSSTLRVGGDQAGHRLCRSVVSRSGSCRNFGNLLFAFPLRRRPWSGAGHRKTSAHDMPAASRINSSSAICSRVNAAASLARAALAIRSRGLRRTRARFWRSASVMAFRPIDFRPMRPCLYRDSSRNASRNALLPRAYGTRWRGSVAGLGWPAGRRRRSGRLGITR
jgi:hypothetical protein